MHGHEGRSILTQLAQHLQTVDGWRSAVAALAREVGDCKAFFFLAGDTVPLLETSDADEVEAFAHFLAAPESALFHRLEGPGGEPIAIVLKRTWRDRRSAGVVLRAKDATGLQESAMQSLAGAAPLLELALTTCFAIGEAQDQFMLGILSTLGLPAATVDRSGTVIAVNASFQDPRLPWSAEEGRPLAIRDQQIQMRLLKLLSTDISGARSVLLRTNGTQSSLNLLPLPEKGRAGFARSSTLLIGSPLEPPSLEMIRSVFALSPEEAKLTRSVLSGHSMDEIAAASGRSVHTVRNQLKAVLSKTGAHSQAQLAALIARLLPLRGGEASRPTSATE